MSSLQQAKGKKTRTLTALVYWEEDVYVAPELYLEEFPLPETAPRLLLTTFEAICA